MQQFRAGVDAVVWLGRPYTFLTTGGGFRKAICPYTDVVKMHYRAPSNAEGEATATFDSKSGQFYVTLAAAGYESGIWAFRVVDSTDSDYSTDYDVFEWGGEYETQCFAAHDFISRGVQFDQIASESHNRTFADYAASPPQLRLYDTSGNWDPSWSLGYWPLLQADGSPATNKADTFRRGDWVPNT